MRRFFFLNFCLILANAMLDFIAVIGESARAMSDIFSEDSDRTE